MIQRVILYYQNIINNSILRLYIQDGILINSLLEEQAKGLDYDLIAIWRKGEGYRSLFEPKIIKDIDILEQKPELTNLIEETIN